MNYVMGIDGGGTKSHLALFDLDGKLMDMRIWGPLNHECLKGSFEQFEAELCSFIDKTLSMNFIAREQLEHVVFGLAGVDNSEQYDIISGKIEHAGFSRYTLCNDAFLGIMAGSPDAAGICAINGTGCTIAAIDYEGKHMQIGGIGDFSYDKGGGSVIGRRVIGTVYCELFRKGPSTILTKYLMNELGISSKDEFTEALTKSRSECALRAEDCNKMAFQGAREGDAVSLALLRDIANNYAGGIACALDEMAFPAERTSYVTMAGSVFVKEKPPILCDMIRDRVSELLPGRKTEYTILEASPVSGAVVWALAKAGVTGLRERVCEQLMT